MTLVALDTHRREKIGGSEAASACGVDSYRSRLMLWYEKVNGVERDESEAMRLGTLLQPAVAEIAGERGYEIMPAPAEGFTHPDLPWMICHPDGFSTVDFIRAGAEIKTRGTGWSEDDDLALATYVMQCQHGMAVCGLNVWLLAILHGGHGGLRLELREVWRDDALIERMIELEQEIVDAVRTETPPKARGAKSDTDAVKLMFPSADGSAIRATGEAWTWVKEARQLKEQRDECDRQYKERVQNIQVYMGRAEQLVSPFDDQVVKWASVNSTRLDTTALKSARPDVYQEFAVATPTRRFTLS
jgi:putative phage-type endonuclease